MVLKRPFSLTCMLWVPANAQNKTQDQNKQQRASPFSGSIHGVVLYIVYNGNGYVKTGSAPTQNEKPFKQSVRAAAGVVLLCAPPVGTEPPIVCQRSGRSIE
jgi:hypothetical protein